MTSAVDEEYRAFVESAPAQADGYLFDTPRCRFWPEPADELLAAPGAQARAREGVVFIELPGGARLELGGLDLATVERALRLLPCRYARLVLELGAQAPVFIERTFSRVVFAPSAVAELELRQPSAELARFPGSPYELVRAYWRNSCAVGERLRGLPSPPTTSGQLRSLLSELHRLLLLGAPSEGRRSFYLPASALARKRATPGELYEAESRVERRGERVVIESGARVSVPLLGGELYWQLLAESVGDSGALDPERRLVADGLDWGAVVLGRAQDEAADRPWFLPPRPLTPEHFLALSVEWQRAAEARTERELLQALAAFHHRFVRLHPLPSGNQSLSMCIVNSLLRPALGVGLPHLLLDQLALRFDPSAYGRLFARAAGAWCTPWPTPTQRMQSLLCMRGELNRFVSALAGQPSLLQARASLLADQHAAGLSLLAPPFAGAGGGAERPAFP
jgi:Fic/DOC family